MSSSSRWRATMDCILIRLFLVACCSVTIFVGDSSPYRRRVCTDSKKSVYRLFLSASAETRESEILKVLFIIKLSICYKKSILKNKLKHKKNTYFKKKKDDSFKVVTINKIYKYKNVSVQQNENCTESWNYKTIQINKQNYRENYLWHVTYSCNEYNWHQRHCINKPACGKVVAHANNSIKHKTFQIKFACHLIQWFNLFDSLCPRQNSNPPCKPRYFLYFCCNYTSDCVLTFWFTEIKHIIYTKYIKIKIVTFCNFSRFKNSFVLRDSITNICDFPTCLWFAALTICIVNSAI